jgi:hypothetical protein
MPDVTAGTCSASQEGVRRRKNDTHAAARSWDPFRELEEISNRFTRLSRWPIGLVTKRLATRKIEKSMYRRDDEGELTSWVFSSSSTAPKKLVAQHVAGLVGLPATRVLTGAELDQCHDEALSLFTELAVALVVRTRRWFFQSRPGNLLLVSTLLLIPVTFTIPYLPHVAIIGSFRFLSACS